MRKANYSVDTCNVSFQSSISIAWWNNANVFGDLLSRRCGGHVSEGSGSEDGLELVALLVRLIWLLSIVELCQKRGLFVEFV